MKAKPKTGFQKQFTVVLLDLWVAWREDPELSIGVPLSTNAWNTSSRYNAIHISKKIIPIIHALRDADLIEFSHGSYDGPNNPSNRNSRIRAVRRQIIWDA